MPLVDRSFGYFVLTLRTRGLIPTVKYIFTEVKFDVEVMRHRCDVVVYTARHTFAGNSLLRLYDWLKYGVVGLNRRFCQVLEYCRVLWM
jgi:hypothetical protein